jgi:hypothetical protein
MDDQPGSWIAWCKRCHERRGLPREVLAEVAELEAAAVHAAAETRRRAPQLLPRRVHRPSSHPGGSITFEALRPHSEV